ncbi:MAG TPA: PTS system mannose/fructose/sorbose family transporter subunit IID [Desulfohalobiaceae bacterium]|nr:PTS system mannose/fructose/sorbose family transporter subunit IID [Desulfohalobiaceae bacterium]
MKVQISTLICCFWRTYFIGANFNTRGLQNIGLVYAMDPGLRSLYRDAKKLYKARKRYLELYNSHPYWTPLLVGYFLFLETKIAQGLVSPQSLKKVKTTATNTLSAIGDSFFGGSLLIFWSLVCIILLLTGLWKLAFLWLIIVMAAIQGFKMATFWLGWTRGLTFLQKLKHMNLVNWGQRIKICNALLLVWILIEVNPFSMSSPIFLLALTVLGIMSWCIAQRLICREILISGILFAMIVCFFIIH